MLWLTVKAQIIYTEVEVCMYWYCTRSWSCKNAWTIACWVAEPPRPSLNSAACLKTKKNCFDKTHHCFIQNTRLNKHELYIIHYLMWKLASSNLFCFNKSLPYKKRTFSLIEAQVKPKGKSVCNILIKVAGNAQKLYKKYFCMIYLLLTCDNQRCLDLNELFSWSHR